MRSSVSRWSVAGAERLTTKQEHLKEKQMHDLESLPISIRQRYEQAQTLVEQGKPDQAQLVLQEMARTLASTEPMLCALFLAGSLGLSGIEKRVETRRTNTTETPRMLFGVQVGRDVTTTTQVDVQITRLSLFK